MKIKNPYDRTIKTEFESDCVNDMLEKLNAVVISDSSITIWPRDTGMELSIYDTKNDFVKGAEIKLKPLVKAMLKELASADFDEDDLVRVSKEFEMLNRMVKKRISKIIKGIGPA